MIIIITLWDFEIQMDLLIPDRKPDQVLIDKKKEKLPSHGFCDSSQWQSKNKRKQKK